MHKALPEERRLSCLGASANRPRREQACTAPGCCCVSPREVGTTRHSRPIGPGHTFPSASPHV